jgi:hypothetical protein
MSADSMNVFNAPPISGVEKAQIDKLIVLVREEEDIKVELFEDRIALLTEGADTLACSAKDLAYAIELARDDLSWRGATGYWFRRTDGSRCRVGEWPVGYAAVSEARAIASLTGRPITDDCYGTVYRPEESA